MHPPPLKTFRNAWQIFACEASFRCVVAQAVSRRLPACATRVQNRGKSYMGSVVVRSALGPVFFEYLGFTGNHSIHQFPALIAICHAGLVQQTNKLPQIASILVDLVSLQPDRKKNLLFPNVLLFLFGEVHRRKQERLRNAFLWPFLKCYFFQKIVGPNLSAAVYVDSQTRLGGTEMEERNGADSEEENIWNEIV